MKIRIEIECSPAEARAMWGLPDLRPVQDAVTNQMVAGITASGPMAAQTTQAMIEFWTGQWMTMLGSMVPTRKT